MKHQDIFTSLKEGILNIDPVYFCEKYLTLDGKPFRLTDSGYKPYTEIYRYIALRAVAEDGKPVVICKSRQVGMTTMATSLEMFFMASGLYGTVGRPPMRIMHCFPQLELALAYAKTKLATTIHTAVIPENNNPIKGGKIVNLIEAKIDKHAEANNALQFKKFEGGNELWVESTGLTGDRIRGRTVDLMFYDEVQDMKGTALANSSKILLQSQYGPKTKGVQVYFGTPKQAGSEFYKFWKQSSQQYFHLGCEKCDKLFPLYTPGSNEWEKIWRYEFIVRCPHCQHDQDKRQATDRGKWIASNPDPSVKYWGYHINQLYLPFATKEMILAEKPEFSAVNTERAYQNEVLGEFYAGSSSPITPEEIEKKCADYGRKFIKHIQPGDERTFYLGCDWGDKVDADLSSIGENRRQQGQSYSCVVVLAVESPNVLSIEYAKRLTRNDPEHKKEVIQQIFQDFRIKLAVGDIGHAGDLTYILQKQFGEQFLASRAVDQVKGRIKFAEDLFPKEIQFDRNYHIEYVYNLMKEGRFRFPFGDWEQLSFLINHICSMEIKISRDANQELRQRYVKGNGPNDGFMALINAFLAYHFDITNGLKIVNPNRMKDPTSTERIPAVIGHVPMMNSLKRSNSLINKSFK